MKKDGESQSSVDELCGSQANPNHPEDPIESFVDEASRMKEVKTNAEDSISKAVCTSSVETDDSVKTEAGCTSNDRLESTNLQNDTEVDEEVCSKKEAVQETERRSSQRLRGKRPKLTQIITSSDEENFDSDDDMEGKGKRQRRARNLSSSKSSSFTKSNLGESKLQKVSAVPNRKKGSFKSSEAVNKAPVDFAPGSFVVLKSDFHSTMTSPIWKIDGKALLQKYTPFDQDGQILYKSTCTYSGWTEGNKAMYYPISVDTLSQNRQETIVKYKKETVAPEDSD